MKRKELPTKYILPIMETLSEWRIRKNYELKTHFHKPSAYTKNDKEQNITEDWAMLLGVVKIHSYA